MRYVIMIIVDGRMIACNRQATVSDVEFLCELSGPSLWDFSTALSLTGKATDVRNDGYGTVVTVAHEEI